MAGRSVINVLVNGDFRQLAKGLDDAGSKITSWSTGVAKKIGAVSLAAGAAAIAIGTKMANAASDLEEAASKTGVIFGDMAGEVARFAAAAESIGVSRVAALDAASTFAVFGKAAGLAGDDLVGFSTDFVALSADLASFNNTSPQDAIEAIGAALRGESEPIRRYGVMLDDATLKQKALELGIYDGTGALSQQQKIRAAEVAIYEQTTAAQGDFARTSDGLANTQRVLGARLQNTMAVLGQQLLPIALEVVTVFGRIIDRVVPLAQQYLPPLVAKIRDAAIRVGDFARELGERLAPTLDRVGEWVRNNTDTVRVFFAVLAGAAAIAGVIALGAAVVALLNPITLAVVALAAIAAGLHYAYQESETFRAVVDTVVGFFTGTVVPLFVQAFGAIRDAVASFVDGFRSRMDDIRSAIDNTRTAIQVVLGAIAALWSVFGDNITAVVRSVFGGIRRQIEGVMKTIRGIIDTILGVISGDFGRAWDGIKSILSGALDFILGAIQSVTAPIIGAFGAIFEAIRIAAGVMRDLFITAVQGMVSFFAELPGRLLAVITTIAGNVAGWFVSVAAGFAAAGITLGKSLIDSLVAFLQRLPSAIVGAVSGAFGALLELGRTIVAKIVEGISSAAGSIGNAIIGAIPGGRTIAGAIGSVGGAVVGGARRVIPFADGGIVKTPTIGLVGEAGPEAVIPLDRWRQMAGGGGGTTINITVTSADPQAVIEAIRLYNRTQGPAPIKVA